MSKWDYWSYADWKRDSSRDAELDKVYNLPFSVDLSDESAYRKALAERQKRIDAFEAEMYAKEATEDDMPI